MLQTSHQARRGFVVGALVFAITIIGGIAAQEVWAQTEVSLTPPALPSGTEIGGATPAIPAALTTETTETSSDTAESADTDVPATATTSTDASTAVTQESSVAATAESSTESISATTTDSLSVALWFWIGGGFLGLLLLMVIVRRRGGGRQWLTFGLPVVGLVAVIAFVLLQVRPQASTVGGASVSLTTMKDGSYRCQVSGQLTGTASTNTAASLTSAIKRANTDAQRAGAIRARLRTNVSQARDAGLKLARRKAQLLELAQVDPAAAAAVTLADKDRANLTQYGNCIESPVVTSGTVETRIVETFGSSDTPPTSEEHHSLITTDGQQLALYAAESLGSGEQQIQGMRLDSAVIVTATDARKNKLWGSGPSPMADVGSGAQRVLILPVNFTGSDGQPLPLPTVNTLDEISEVLFTDVAEYYQAVSNGNLTITGDVGEWVVLNRNPLTEGTSTSFVQVANAFETLILETALRDGQAVRDYDKIVVYSPNTWKSEGVLLSGDAWGTLGEADHFVDPDGDGVRENVAVGVASVWQVDAPWNTKNRMKFVLAHELGHTLGSHHADLYGCHEMSSSCQPLDRSGFPLAPFLEYQNRFALMGNPMLYWETGELLDDPVSLKDMRGWLSATDLQEITASGEYVLRPLEGSSENGPIALRIQRDRDDVSYGHLYLEYRSDPRITTVYPNVGRSALLTFTNDLMFHSELLVADKTVPIDLEKETLNTTFSQAGLTPEAAPFVDVESGITVDVLEAGSDFLRVSVQLAESTIDGAPTTLTAPAEGAVSQTTPTLQFTAAALPTARSVQYVVQMTDATGATLTYDQRQSQIGWSGQSAPLGGLAYAPTGTASFTPPSLPPGTYSWQAKAIVTYGAENNDAISREGEYSASRNFEIATPESYFLFQVQAPHGPANSVVQKLVGVDLVKAAREAIAAGSSTLVPKGTLVKAPNAMNPLWGWSWETSTMALVPKSESTCAGDVAALELGLSTWNTSTFCPADLRVAKELGATLPTKSYQLTLPKNEWRMVEVPGMNMRLSADSAKALTEGKLYAFKYLSTHGTYEKITDPLYSFRTGEGYMMLHSVGVTLSFQGDEAYADAVHLRQGWNLVSLPGDARVALASVYSKSRKYQTPVVAVQNKVLYGTALVPVYSGGNFTYQSVSMSQLADSEGVTRQAVWILANEEVLLQFKAM